MTDFSIVIPNLNQSGFLPWALESLKSQDKAYYELALMDGGSTDGFGQAVKPYLGMVSWMSIGPDNGQAAAIFEGFERTSGDIMAWLNADDYYFPGAFSWVEACFENDPDIDVLYGDAVHVDENGFFISYFPHTRAFDPDSLPSSCYICQPACFVRRRAYESAGGVNPDLCYTMDWDLWCRLAQNGAKFRYLPKLLAAVRYYRGTKTSSCDPIRYREIRRIERMYKKTSLPLSWLGFYLNDLAEKESRQVNDIPTFLVLSALKRFKHAWGGGHHDSLNRMADKNEGRIRIPWYDSRQWKKLHLELEPDNIGYRVEIDGRHEFSVFPDKGRFTIKFSESYELESIQKERTVSIQPLVVGKPWKLLRFFCDT
ncbi:glycosyltransferase family 2 protein [Desulfobacterales bacterium HSG16]|nr:glycosyltransferase family 2 protein [Desulfobacterales bacterium HSG16]